MKSPAKPQKAALSLKTRTRKQAEPELLPDTVSLWEDFYKIVRKIPKGRVSTYGAVAAMAGRPRYARHVGYALAAIKETGKTRGIPWQRVLGAKGKNRAAVTIKDPIGGSVQRMLLESEGVVFDEKGSISLDRFGWFEGKIAKLPQKTTKKAAATKKVSKKATKKTKKTAQVLPTKRR